MKVAVGKGEVTPEQMEEIEGNEFVTPKEIANKFRYSYQWVLWMLQEKRIKGIKPLGSGWRIPRSEYERILKEGVPPLPKEKEKPAVTEIPVDDKKIMDRVVEPKVEKTEPKSIFPFGLFG